MSSRQIPSLKGEREEGKGAEGREGRHSSASLLNSIGTPKCHFAQDFVMALVMAIGTVMSFDTLQLFWVRRQYGGKLRISRIDGLT